MMSIPEEGETVQTKYGQGVIVKKEFGSFTVHVEELGFNIKMELEEFETSEMGESLDEESDGASWFKTNIDGDISNGSRQAIEAFRFGVVPETQLMDLTVGYSNIEDFTNSVLSVPRETVSQVVGPFGSGKSHTMAVIRKIGEASDYTTLRVEIDGEKLTLSDPKNLIYKIASSLGAKGLGTDTPVLDMFIRAISEGKPPPTVVPNSIIDRTNNNYSTTQLVSRPDLIDIHGYELNIVLTGSPELTANEVRINISREQSVDALKVKLRPLIGRALINRPTDFIQAIAGLSAVAKLAGYKGIILTIDEFEIEDNLSGAKQVKTIKMLEAFLLYYHPDSREKYKDSPKYSTTIKDLPERFPVSTFIGTVGSESEIGQLVGRVAEGRTYELNPPNENNLSHLAAIINPEYRKAYSISEEIDESLFEQVFDEVESQDYGGAGLMRTFIKRYVSELDTHFKPFVA